MNLSKAMTRMDVYSKGFDFVQSGGHRGFVLHLNGLQKGRMFCHGYFALRSLLFRESILWRSGKESIGVADIVFVMGGAEIETFPYV